MAQEWIALGVVAIAAISVARKLLFAPATDALAAWLLRRGRVAWAMRLRSDARRAGACGEGSCGGCGGR